MNSASEALKLNINAKEFVPQQKLTTSNPNLDFLFSNSALPQQSIHQQNSLPMRKLSDNTSLKETKKEILQYDREFLLFYQLAVDKPPIAKLKMFQDYDPSPLNQQKKKKKKKKSKQRSYSEQIYQTSQAKQSDNTNENILRFNMEQLFRLTKENEQKINSLSKKSDNKEQIYQQKKVHLEESKIENERQELLQQTKVEIQKNKPNLLINLCVQSAYNQINIYHVQNQSAILFHIFTCNKIVLKLQIF